MVTETMQATHEFLGNRNFQERVLNVLREQRTAITPEELTELVRFPNEEWPPKRTQETIYILKAKKGYPIDILKGKKGVDIGYQLMERKPASAPIEKTPVTIAERDEICSVNELFGFEEITVPAEPEDKSPESDGRLADSRVKDFVHDEKAKTPVKIPPASSIPLNEPSYNTYTAIDCAYLVHALKRSVSATDIARIYCITVEQATELLIKASKISLNIELAVTGKWVE